MEDFMHRAGTVILRNETLGKLPEGVLRPTYDRSAITPGIVHIGMGNFHRAHQAWYLHRLMQQGEALDWGIIGAGVRKEDMTQRERLLAQDCLTTLIELDPAGRTVEVIGSIIGFVPVEEDNSALIAQLSDPAIRIVSLTVTEGGYFLDPATKKFDPGHPDMIHDAETPDRPRSAFGAIVAALRQRRDQGLRPFACQSCDNLPGNGAIMREVVIGLANMSDPELATWIGAKVSFPNSMVDCIVPATGSKELKLVRGLGIEDNAPVTHENFRQWVLEEDFCAGRPAWEKIGATFTDDVHCYEEMKLRILNAGHQFIAAPAELLGLETIATAMAYSPIADYLRKVILQEVSPHVDAVPGMTAEAYLDLVATRFANPEIHDTVRRVAFDGSSRHTGMVLPVVRDALKAGARVDGLALTQALWARMCAGIRDNGSRIEPNDPEWDALNKTAIAAKDNPLLWLEQRKYYGAIGDNADFAAAFERWLRRLYADGTEITLGAFLGK